MSVNMVRQWVSAVLCAVGGSLGTGLLAGCAIPIASAEVAEVQVRLVHVAPNAPRIDLEVGGVRAAQGVAYGAVSEYVRMPAGEYDIVLFSTPENPGQPASSKDSVARTVAARTVANLRGGGVFSVVAADEPNRVTVLVLEDNINPLFDQALVRFVHATPDAPPLQWQGEQGRVLIPQLAFGQVSTFQAMRPGFTQIQVATAPSASGGQMSPSRSIPLQRFDLQLEAGKVYTLYVAGLLRSNPSLSGVLAEETRARRLL
ncbi:DUF4397 domain-containing protein [Synechococcus sp. H65.1]|uniref:DUF4397 domain-containing protein n=1 Tax=unclassified Synechococcus TaxID=2626047 RepID=UPI0039C02259